MEAVDSLEGGAVIGVEDILRAACGSAQVVESMADKGFFKGDLLRGFDVFVLADGRLEHNTLLSPEEELAGIISWQIQYKGLIDAMVSEWVEMADWKITCSKILVLRGGGQLESLLKTDSKLRLPTLSFESRFDSIDNKNAELRSVAVWVKAHNAMLARSIKSAYETTAQDIQ